MRIFALQTACLLPSLTRWGHPRSISHPSAGPRCRCLPKSEADVENWACGRFFDLVLSPSGQPLPEFSLEKALMLVALEEEASQRSPGFLAGQGTWNLERLDALASEAAARFYANAVEAGIAESVVAVANANGPDSALFTVHMDLMKSYPTHVISAINDVLFARHGYGRMRRHGDPKSTNLGIVLEVGQGSPGVLAVLYMAVAERMGLSMVAAPLDEGRFFAVWPASAEVCLSIGSERFVVDPYGQGSLVSETEIAALFLEPEPFIPQSQQEEEGVDNKVANRGNSADIDASRSRPLLQPANSAEILAAILGPLRDSHWCAALQCPPEPAFMVPISVDVALRRSSDVSMSSTEEEESVADGEHGRQDNEHNGNDETPWWPAKGHNLLRALAAAKKRQALLPHDAEAALHVGLLHYFNDSLEEAWQECGVALALAEDSGCWSREQVEDIRMVMEIARVQSFLLT